MSENQISFIDHISLRGAGTISTAKRSKYISSACERCKRSKTKCNGLYPCVRCKRLSFQCVYPRQRHQSEIGVRQQLESDPLPARAGSTPRSTDSSKVENWSNMDNGSFPYLRTLQTAPLLPANSNFAFRGPTSSRFGFDVAKSSLKNIGFVLDEENIENNENASIIFEMDRDPLWCITKDEAFRLIKIYEDECNSMYPLVDMNEIREHAARIYDFIKITASFVLQDNLADVSFLGNIDNNLLKVILASALVMEGKGDSALGRFIFESIKYEESSSRWEGEPKVEIKRLKFIIISAIYQFQRDEEHMAWRKLGQAARLCIEIGLHRSEVIMTLFESEAEIKSAIRVFWCIYVLDRRWSFGCGLSFALSESELDSQMPEPDSDIPYVASMVKYAQIASRAWMSISAHALAPDKEEEMDFLDFQLRKWRTGLPDELQIHKDETNNQDQAQRRLRAILFLRFNQMRILIYRRILYSPVTIVQNFTNARKTVEIAKQSIRLLVHLNRTSDIYQSQEVCFNHFLYSALVVLFLAISHAKTQFATSCSREIFMTLDLVKSLSSSSYVSNRLWKSIKCLIDIARLLELDSFTSNPLSADTIFHKYPQQHGNSTARATRIQSIETDAFDSLK